MNISAFTSMVYPYRVFIWLDPHTSLINTHLSKARIHTITYTPQKKKKKKEEREKKIVYMKTCRMMKKAITGNSQPILVAM